MFTAKSRMQAVPVEIDITQAQEDLNLLRTIMHNTGATLDEGLSLMKAPDSLREYATATDQALWSAERFKVASDAQRISIINSNNALKQTTIETKFATLATNAFTTAANMAITVLAAWAVSQVFTMINDYIHRVDKARESLNAFTSEIEGMNNQYKDHQKLVDEASASYDELAKHVNTANNTNIDLNDEDYKKFLDMTNELAEAFPELKVGVDDNNNSIINLGNSGERSAEQLKGLLDAEREISNIKITNDLDEKLKDAFTSFEDYTSEKALKEGQLAANIATQGFDFSIGQIEYDDTDSAASNAARKYIEEFYGVLTEMTYDPKYKGLASTKLSNAAHLVYDSMKQPDGFGKYKFDLSILDIPEDAIVDLQHRMEEAGYTVRETARNQAKLNETEIRAIEAKQETLWVEMRANIGRAMETYQSYKEFDGTGQQLAQALLQSFDSSFLAEAKDEGHFDFLLKNIFAPIETLDLSNHPELAISLNEFLDPTIPEEKRLELYYQLQQVFDQMQIGIKLTPIVQKDIDTSNEFDQNIYRLSYHGEDVEGQESLLAYTKEFDLEQKKAWSDVTKGAKSADEAIEQWKASLKEANQIVENIEIPSIESALSGAQKAMEPIEQLTKILGDFRDGGDFDFSSVLNNDSFKETFGKYTSEYEAFMKILNDTNASYEDQKRGLEGLATVYLQQTENLSAITEETKRSTAAMLEQAGIINAEQIVEAELVARRIDETKATYEVAKANAASLAQYGEMDGAINEAESALRNEVSALEAEAQELGLTADQINAYYLKKQLANSANFDTFDEIQQLNNIVAALGVGTQAWNTYYMAQAKLNAVANNPNYKEFDEGGIEVSREAIINRWTAVSESAMKDLQAELDNIAAKAIISPSGSSSSGGGGGSSDKEDEVDGYTIALQNLENQIKNVENAENDAFDTYEERGDSLQKKLDLLKQKLDLTQEAYKAYMSEAEKYLTKLPEEYQDLIKSGNKNAVNTIPSNLKDDYDKAAKYYEMATSMSEKRTEAEKALEQYALDRLAILKEEKENQRQALDYQISKLENEIQLRELAGNNENVDLQNKLIALQEERIRLYGQEASEIDNLRSEMLSMNYIQSNTKADYEFQKGSQDARLGMQQAEISKAQIEKNKKDTEEEKKYQKEKQEAEEKLQKNYIDWVERAITHIQKRIDKWTSQAERFFSYWNKNMATNKAILFNRDMIAAQESAYKVYLKHANTAAKDAGQYIKSDDEKREFEIADIGDLSKAYKKLIEEGAMKIETLDGTEEAQQLQKQIDVFTEWYDKAIEAQSKITDLYATERDLIKQKLNSITTYFDTLEDYFSSFTSKLEAQLSAKNASGQRTTIADLVEMYGTQVDSLVNEEEELWAYQTGISKENTRASEEIQAELNSKLRNYGSTDAYNAIINERQELLDKQAAYDQAVADRKEYQALANQAKKEGDKATQRYYDELVAEANQIMKANKLTGNEKNILTNLNKQVEALNSLMSESTYSDVITAKVSEYRAIQDEYDRLTDEINQKMIEKSEATTSAEKNEIQREINALKNERKSTTLTSKQKKELALYEKEISAMTDVGDFGITRNLSDAIAKRNELNEKLSTYNDLMATVDDYNAQIADIQQQIKDVDVDIKYAQDSYEKKELQAYKKQLQQEKSLLEKERNSYKSQANKSKLSSTEQQVLKAVTAQVNAINEFQQNAVVDEAIASTTQYQDLLKKIGELQSRTSLSASQQTTLSLYLDELNAINQGVAVDQLDSYISTFEKWWKLNNKSTLSASEFKQLQTLNDRKTAIEEAYKEQMAALQQELQDALVAEGKSAADLTQNITRKRAELEQSYKKQIASVNDEYLQTSQYAKFKSELDKMEQDAQKAYDQGKKYSKQTDLEIARARNEAFEKGATFANFTAYQEAINFVTNAAKSYASKTKDTFENVWNDLQSGSLTIGTIGSSVYKDSAGNRKKLDQYFADLQKWNTEKLEQINNLNIELEDKLKELQLEYDQQINANEESLAEKREALWQTAKEIANWQVGSLQVIIDNLDTMINKYKAVASMLEEVSINTLKKYNVMSLLGLDKNATDISELLSDQLKNAISSTEVKIADLIDQADLYQDLLNAADKNDFAKIFESYYESASESTRSLIDKMVDQLNNNSYENNEWIDEWNQGLADAISNTIDAIQSIEDLKSEFRENIYFKGISNAIEQLEAFSSKYSSMADLISDDWVSSSADGGLTIYGMAKIKSLGQQLSQAQSMVEQYAKKVNAIREAQSDPSAQFASEEEYTKALNEAMSEYYSSLTNVETISNQIYQLAKQNDEQEIKHLEKVIELRKKALSSKKEYYDLDKQIKDSNKSIEALESQIQALSGINTAEAKSRIASLEEQLVEAQEKKKDIELTHLYELETEGLDEWLVKLNETLDDSTKTVDESFEKFAETLASILNEASLFDSTEAYQNILDLLMGTGYKMLDSGDTTVATTGSYNSASSGTYTSTSSGQYVEVSQSEFLNSLSSSINAATMDIVPYLNLMTNNLADISSIMQKQIVDSLKGLSSKDTSVNVTLNYDNLLNVQGNVDKDALPDLKSLLKQSADYTKSEIYSELKKMGIVKTY